ncbi:hypothetical protein MPLSOD_220004 [Mesorhizobium sp. SOD10]|nr:hypothetical protein MPLSOD_220004 [Mesorhizobium sp. SOD10]
MEMVDLHRAGEHVFPRHHETQCMSHPPGRWLAHAPGSAGVVGIDHWAWRKGQRYGTLSDLERNRVPDLLDLNADTVAAWLERHPGIEVIARNRALLRLQMPGHCCSSAITLCPNNIRRAIVCGSLC